MAVRHANHGLAEIPLGVAHGVVHRAIRRARFALGDVFAARVEDDGFRFHGVSLVGSCGLCSDYGGFDSFAPIHFLGCINMYGI